MPTHWLEQYASDCFRWQRSHHGGREIFHRPLGLVEFAFDTDGRYFEGRADLSTQLSLCIRSRLDTQEVRERVLLAWTNLRCQHVLLHAKALKAQAYMRIDPRVSSDSYFVVETPGNIDEAVQEAQESIVFIEDHYQAVNAEDFYRHSHNTGRIPDTEKALARLFVLPPEQKTDGRLTLKFMLVTAHQITEGLTNIAWLNHFIQLLNQPSDQLRKALPQLIDPETVQKRLPLPQEALYPPITGSTARQRWFWLLTRILRHVRKPLPAMFSNPLERSRPLADSVSYAPAYADVFDYSKKPPLNSSSWPCHVPLKYTERLHRLSRQAKASIGAGCFALVAIVMMEMYESREPKIQLAARKHFGSGFPLTPRAFFDHKEPPDSLMLAFADALVLPFLSSDLDLDGRIRLLARQAHRQLAVYQKRKKTDNDGTEAQYMGSRGAGRLLAMQYIGSLERADSLLPPHLRSGVNPQGAYPMRPNPTLQTCGVSSLGKIDALIRAAMFDLDDEAKSFVADYRTETHSGRARDGEFIVIIGGAEDGLWATVCVDDNANDPDLMAEWKRRLESLLVDDENSPNRAHL